MTAPLEHRLQATLGEGYTVEQELGGGGMSRVFAALDRGLGRRVVVKVLSPELAYGVNGERFRREIQVAAQLQHPHIVPVLAAGEVDGLPFFIMPFVTGQSLRQRLDGTHALPVPEAVGILRDIAKALAYAHAAGVVHRDIKPENVLLSGGSAAVTDFGIAKALSTSRVAAGATLTQGGTSLGTPAYMAPEQAAADPNADHRADLYSFGILAYELLAGLPPFHGRPPQALLTAHMAESPPPLHLVAPTIPPALAALVMRCLEKSPADRPASAGMIVEMLDRFDVSGSHATMPVREVKRTRRLRFAMLGGAGVVLALLGSVWGWRSTHQRAPELDPNLVAVPPFRVATADPSLHYLREGMLDLLAAKLTGEGGLRTTEPRMILTAWQEAGGSSTRDLDPRASLDLARRLAAGQLLLGDVVGTPNHLVLNLSMVRVPGGEQLARVSVEGPPDSLAQMVDRVAAQLLSSVAGESSDRLPKLLSTSLPALRAYLDGKARLRRGQATQAAEDFGRALDADSTFALAGLGLRLAASWYGDTPASERGLRAAYQGRARLSPRDRALLDAVAGPHYPEPSSTVEEFQARQRYLQVAPDRADAWELYADEIFHFGPALGIQDPAREALEAFRRSVDLDSTNAVAFSHILMLALHLGDTATQQRIVRLSSLVHDTASATWLAPYRWFEAHLRGDSATFLGFRDSVTLERPNFLYRFMDQTLFNGVGTEDAWYVLQRLLLASTNSNQKRGFYGTAHVLALLRGRPSDATAYVQQRYAEPDDVNLLITILRDAMMANTDTAAARSAALKLARMEATPGTDSAGRERERQVIRALEPWRLSRGDTSHTRRSIERLRAIQQASGGPTTDSEVEIAFIEAMEAHLLRRSSFRPRVMRLDSLLAATDYKNIHPGRYALVSVATALMLESLGENERAWQAARRRAVGWNQDQPYLATQLREEGRLAALAGHRDPAIQAYRHYLGLRTHPEPAMEREVQLVREELARLTQTDSR